MRTKGMTLAKMPLMVWMLMVVSGQILIAMPPLTAAQIMLLLDRYLGAHFFDTQAGGSAVFLQHFFLLFWHPPGFVFFLSRLSSASGMLPPFSRQTMFRRRTRI